MERKTVITGGSKWIEAQSAEDFTGLYVRAGELILMDKDPYWPLPKGHQIFKRPELYNGQFGPMETGK